MASAHSVPQVATGRAAGAYLVRLVAVIGFILVDRLIGLVVAILVDELVVGAVLRVFARGLECGQAVQRGGAHPGRRVVAIQD